MASTKNAPGSTKSEMTSDNSMDQHRQLSTIMGHMNNMRKDGTLCDVTLVVQGRHFPAHRYILAAAGEFFRLMFTTRMMESMSHEVKLRNVDPDIIELLLEFIYTARISVNSSNVQSLLEAANQYQIEPVMKMCVAFLKEQIDAINCLGISALADYYIHCQDLKAKAEDFVLIHFSKVYKEDEFLQLDVTRLTHLLQHDKLVIESEAQIYDAAVRWLKHDVYNRQQYIVEVLGCVRFPLVSKTFLSKTVQAEPLIQDNPQCLRMVLSAMGKHLGSCKGQQLSGEGKQPRWKKNNYYIAVFEGSQLQTHLFNPKNYTWEGLCSPSLNQGGSAVFCDYVVYIVGGRKDDMVTYDVMKKEWWLQSGPPTKRNFLTACVSEGKIYTSGGAVGKSALDVFECYDTRTESWQVKPSMLMARCGHGSVGANGLIYVCGGIEGPSQNNVSRRVLNNCEVYDPSTQQWKKLRGMKDARKNHGLVVVNNRIYAVGGQGSTGALNSVECYDIASNKWRSVSSMPWRDARPKCAAVGEIIYVVAGKGCRVTAPVQYVLEYHTLIDRWVTCRKAEACTSSSNSLTCVIDMPHNDDDPDPEP